MTRRRSKTEERQRRLRRWLYSSGTAYAAGGLAFAVRPQDAPTLLGRLGGRRLERDDGGVYNALACAYMATIAALAWSAAENEDARPALIGPLLVAKATSSLALLNRYRSTRARGYAVGAGVDAAIFVTTALLYDDARAR